MLSTLPHTSHSYPSHDAPPGSPPVCPRRLFALPILSPSPDYPPLAPARSRLLRFSPTDAPPAPLRLGPALACAVDGAAECDAMQLEACAVPVHRRPCLCCAPLLLDATDAAAEVPIPFKAPFSLPLELRLRQESTSSSLTRSMTSSVSSPSRAIPDIWSVCGYTTCEVGLIR